MTLRIGLAALALLLVLPTVSAQGVSETTPRRPVTSVVALTNARVVQAPGRVLDRATVVVRDGRIVAVGADAEVPFDARVIEADSFTVYAGFVDALGYAGVPKPEDPPRYEGDRGDPPRQLAGLLPDRDVRDVYDPSDSAIKAMREAGFAAAHVAPRDGLFSGQGSVVLLRETGRMEDNAGVVLAGPTSLLARIDTAPGVYPSTPMGVLSVMRETVENTRRHRAAQEAYDRNPGGTMRPRYDPVLAGLEPLIDGDRQLVFAVDGWLDGFRALRATDEMELAPILAGVPDVAPLLDKLSASGTAVFTPLALPDTVKADSLAMAVELPTAAASGVYQVTNRRTASYNQTDDERTALVAQQRAAVQRAEESPARLASAEIPFAFASLDAKPADIRKNLRRMIAAGLSPDDALAALTTSPARLLGLEAALGTVETGKLANLVVATGDVFADTTDIRFVLVEGVTYEVDKAKTTSGDDSTTTAVGSWDFTVPEAEQFGTFVLEDEGGALTGTITQADGTTDPILNAKLEGSTLSFQVEVEGMGTATISGTITGREFSGTVDIGSVGSFAMNATRQPE
ncbi:MAG: amidohydrolase family protein [Rubricoccaceae bacterium]